MNKYYYDDIRTFDTYILLKCNSNFKQQFHSKSKRSPKAPLGGNKF